MVNPLLRTVEAENSGTGSAPKGISASGVEWLVARGPQFPGTMVAPTLTLCFCQDLAIHQSTRACTGVPEITMSGVLGGDPTGTGDSTEGTQMGCRPELWRSPKSEASGASRPWLTGQGVKQQAGARPCSPGCAQGPWCSGSKPRHLHFWDLTHCSQGLHVAGAQRLGRPCRVSLSSLHTGPLRATPVLTSVTGGQAVIPAHLTDLLGRQRHPLVTDDWTAPNI